MTEALKPCPFCGKVPEAGAHENDWCEPPEWIVICLCRSDPPAVTEAEAIARWNTRAEKEMGQ